MRKRLLLNIGLCTALALFASACRNAHPQTSEVGRQSPEVESIEDSGRRMAGDFIIQAWSDDYVANSLQASPHGAFSFKDDGSFRSEQLSRGATRIEAGSYLISAQGELVLYIEMMGSDALTEARVERYKIEEASETMLKLRRNSSASLVLRK